MRQFSIKDLERFSGIKAHTIRIWENRHGILVPERTPGGIRTYTLDDVKTLLHIGLLAENGFKISQLAKVSKQNLEDKTRSLLTETGRLNKIVSSLILSMYSSDIDGLENILDTAVSTYGIETTITNILIPFLEKVELLSYKDTSVEAHLAVTAVRKKLIVGIESIRQREKPKKTALLFLPKGEHYDLLLLYITYLLKKKGIRTLYLGTNISQENLEKALTEKKPHYIYTYLSARHSYDPKELINFLKKKLPDTSLFIAEEEEVARKNMQPNVHFFYFKNNSTAIVD